MSVKFWCFTSNNPVSVPFFDDSIMTYLVYQLEEGEQGTRHHQGYVEFSARKSMAQCKALLKLPTAHVERRRGSGVQASDYCMKEGRIEPTVIHGTLAPAPGNRTDLNDFIRAVADGLSKRDSFESFPDIHAKYPRFVATAYENLRTSRLPVPEPFLARPGWQTELCAILSEPPSPREVIWIHDPAGNSGKSLFCGTYSPDHTYTITGGRHADIYFAYSFEPYVFFDWVRAGVDFPYAVAESFKNGYFLSTKYDVRRVRFITPHVVIFSNSPPDRSQLSADRWRVINVINIF